MSASSQEHNDQPANAPSRLPPDPLETCSPNNKLSPTITWPTGFSYYSSLLLINISVRLLVAAAVRNKQILISDFMRSIGDDLVAIVIALFAGAICSCARPEAATSLDQSTRQRAA